MARQTVNLWELLTSARDNPKADELVSIAGSSEVSVNELSLEADNEGRFWKVRLFSCYEDTPEITLQVSRYGLVLETKVMQGDILSQRRFTIPL